jgi:hypothetical protein
LKKERSENMSEPNNSGSNLLLLRRVVSRSEEDRDVVQPLPGQEPLRMTVSSDEHEGGNPSFSSAMGTTTAAATATAAAATQQAVWIEPNPGADTMLKMPPHNGGDNGNDPRTSFGGGGGAGVGTSSSAQALHLTDDSVKVPTKAVVFATIPSAHRHHHHHAAARERDMSSSSLSDDAEDDDDDDCGNAKDPSRGGLLRFVTAMVGASKDASNNSNFNPRDVVPRSTPAQRSSANLDDEDGDARMRGEAEQDYGHGDGDGAAAAAAAEEVSSSAGEEESTMERTGSQNSSRDWGWFEDVHMSLNEVTAGGLGLLPPPSKSNKKSGAPVSAAAATGYTSGAHADADPQGRRQQQQQQESNRPNNNNHQQQQQQKPPKKKRGLIPQVSSGLQDYAAAVKSQDTTGASRS